jgi:hypothetical protein
VHIPVVELGKFLKNPKISFLAEQSAKLVPVLRIIMLHGNKIDLVLAEIEMRQNFILASLCIDGHIIYDLRSLVFLEKVIERYGLNFYLMA